jgi:hypothetical protein
MKGREDLPFFAALTKRSSLLTRRTRSELGNHLAAVAREQ